MDWLLSLIRKVRASSVARQAGTYFAFKLLDKAVPFLLLPIVARALGPSEYGVFVLFQAIAGLVLPLMTLSVDSSILLNFFKVSERAFPVYFSSGYRLLLISAFVVVVGLWLGRDPIAALWGFPAEAIVLVAAFCFFQFHTNLAMNLYQVRRQPVRYGVFSVGLTLSKNALMLVLVLGMNMGWYGVAIGYTVAQGAFAVAAEILFLRQGLLQARVRRVYIWDNVKVGYPLSAHQLGAWGASSATRVIVAALLGSASAGSFGVGAAVAMLVMFVQDAFNKAYVPYLFDQLEDERPESQRALVRLTYGYVLGLSVFGLVTGGIGVLLLEPVFGADFADGTVVVVPLCLAYVFEGAYKMHVNYIFYSKRTYLILLITVTTGLVNIGLSLLLIRTYGLLGSALSLCIVNACAYVLAWVVGQKVHPMPWRLS